MSQDFRRSTQVSIRYSERKNKWIVALGGRKVSARRALTVAGVDISQTSETSNLSRDSAAVRIIGVSVKAGCP